MNQKSSDTLTDKKKIEIQDQQEKKGRTIRSCGCIIFLALFPFIPPLR